MGHKQPSLYLTLKLGGETITIGGDSPYRLLASGLVGADGADVLFSLSERAQLDGDPALSIRVPARTLTLDFEITDHKNREAHRSRLLSFFAPRAEGQLTVSRKDSGQRDRTIGCMLGGAVRMTQETMSDFIRVHVPLYCPDPYFYEERAPRVLSRKGEALLTFPLTVMSDAPLTASVATVSSQLSVNNAGDADTGFLLTLTAVPATEDGVATVVNPCITRPADGAYIRILETISEGDVLTVCTLHGAKYILLNGERRMRFDRGSSFFTLDPGINHMVLSSDEKTGHLEATLSWRTRHFGA